MLLYRGDSLPPEVRKVSARQRGRTFADHFCGGGLMARFADGGRSALLQGQDLLGLVLVHVGYYVGCRDQELADHSPLISFSADRKAAFDKMERTTKKTLIPCKFYEATHFIWQLEIELGEPLELGRYPFSYRSDPVNCREIVAEQLSRGLLIEAVTGGIDALGDMTTLSSGLLNGLAMHAAAKDMQEHYAEIIDVVTFVRSHDTAGREECLLNNTLKYATRDQEWLVYPKDPMRDGYGFSSQFFMNQYLSVDRCYKVLRKPNPASNKLQSQPPRGSVQRQRQTKADKLSSGRTLPQSH